jgi:hypothetical protein
MTNVERPTAAFVLSLIGGIFILLGGGMMSMLGYGFRGMMSSYGRWGYGMMRPGSGMMGLAFGIMGILGLVFGVIVIISAIMLNSKPQEHTTWGTLIVIFSVLSIVGSAMGGFGIGLILGLIGGVLAITWKPTGTKN